MSTWDELRPVLAGLRDQEPRPLRRCPDPDGELAARTPPFKITLAPWATEAAEQLHRQFGDDVELTVGWLPYPPGSRAPRRRAGAAPAPPPELIDPREVTVELDGPATVSSGHTLHHHLLVRNHTGSELRIQANGGVTATVVDLETGSSVGGYYQPRITVLKVFAIAPGASLRIPLTTGTAGSTPEIGYAVPAGDWGIRVTLKTETDSGVRPRRTHVLPLTITA